MKYSILGSILIFIVLLLSVSVVAAQPIKIEIEPLERTTQPFNSAFFDITLENNMGVKESFYVFVSGTPSSWDNLDTSYIEMAAHSSARNKLEFYPNDVPGTYEYEVFFQSVSRPEVIVSEKVQLTVVEETEEEGRVRSHEIEKVGNSVNIKMTLYAETEEDVTVDFSLLTEAGDTIATDTRTYTVEGEREIVHTIPLPESLVTGKYNVKVVVKETDESLQSSFEIEPVRKIVKEEEETGSSLFHEVRISVANEGNVIEKDYKVSTKIPTGFLTFYPQPAKCEGDKCEWVIPKLNPDESLEIIYRVEYWPLIAGGLILAVLIVSSLVFGWNKVNTPTLSKRVKGKRDDFYTTVLEIRNAGKKISNVVIRDKVSPLFKVKDEFETVKPAVKEAEEGTELVWSLGAIEPRDHRVLHYKVKPMISGKLKLPKAYMRYETDGGKRSTVESKETVLAA